MVCLIKILFGISRINNDTLSHLVDSHAPLKTRTITIRLWYTDEIATEKRKRRSLERRWRSSRLSSDYENYVTQCNVVNNMLKAAKVSYYGSIIEGSKHDHDQNSTSILMQML